MSILIEKDNVFGTGSFPLLAHRRLFLTTLKAVRRTEYDFPWMNGAVSE